MSEPSPLSFDYAAAVAHLIKRDRRMAKLIGKSVAYSVTAPEHQTPYESLLRAIVYQSISGKAAKVIYDRIVAFGTDGRAPTPEELLRVRKPALRKAGLSFAKIAAVRDLAQKTIDGVVPALEEAHKLSDQELIERLISVRGVGPWTVEMFLIFGLGRPDVLPIHDLGVQKGFALTYGKRKMPKPRELAEFGERWRPYRTVASWYMWRAVEHAGKRARKITKIKVTVKKRVIKKRASRPR
jgi:DNA-3-methyladenine glycosylase II